jgi:hypothetical protein
MQEAVSQHKRSYRFNESDREARLVRAMDRLERENSRLKSLVVRLSETIIRNVATKR